MRSKAEQILRGWFREPPPEMFRAIMRGFVEKHMAQDVPKVEKFQNLVTISESRHGWTLTPDEARATAIALLLMADEVEAES